MSILGLHIISPPFHINITVFIINIYNKGVKITGALSCKNISAQNDFHGLLLQKETIYIQPNDYRTSKLNILLQLHSDYLYFNLHVDFLLR